MDSNERAMPDRSLWSVSFGTPTRRGDTTELVVLAPPGSSLDAAFARLKQVLPRTGRHVRLVARGAVQRARRPAWLLKDVRDQITLTELDAYLPCERTSLVKAAEEALGRWLAATFEGALPAELEPDRVFWASSMWRVFAVWFMALPLAQGLAHHHAADEIISIDPTWPGTLALESLVAAAGGTFSPKTPAAPRSEVWTAKVMALTGANLAAACAVRSREFVRETASRKRLNALRADGDGKMPDVWIGLLGAWPRSSRAVIEGVGSAAREHGRTMGVLLQSTLQAGSVQADLVSRGAVFPALDHPMLEGAVVAVDQCAAAENVSDLAENMVSTAQAVARIARRLARGGPRLTLGSLTVDLTRDLAGLARLATFEVLRAREAALATRALVARRSFKGQTIVWPHASIANVVVPDLMLQAAGATTLDLVHGALAAPIDFITHARTHCSYTVWWTESEVRYIEPYLPWQRMVGGYVPRVIAERNASVHRAPGERPLRVLVLSNYSSHNQEEVHLEDSNQDALLESVSAATRACGEKLELRWRPHPYDDRGLVDASLARWTGDVPLTLATAPDGLQVELAWADIVITSISSSIVEAILHPVAVFVHDVPAHESGVLMSLFDASRRFGDAADLTSRFGRLVEQFKADDPARLSSEDALRESFFGPSRRPRELKALLWPPSPRADGVR